MKLQISARPFFFSCIFRKGLRNEVDVEWLSQPENLVMLIQILNNYHYSFCLEMNKKHKKFA